MQYVSNSQYLINVFAVILGLLVVALLVFIGSMAIKIGQYRKEIDDTCALNHKLSEALTKRQEADKLKNLTTLEHFRTIPNQIGALAGVSDILNNVLSVDKDGAIECEPQELSVKSTGLYKGVFEYLDEAKADIIRNSSQQVLELARDKCSADLVKLGDAITRPKA